MVFAAIFIAGTCIQPELFTCCGFRSEFPQIHPQYESFSEEGGRSH